MIQEQEVRFRSGKVELAGTIASPGPEGRFPAVLLIAGSGQVDRNENHKRIRLNALYDISQYLAENGFASLRYDKRGVGQSQGDYWTTGFYDRVEDAGAALDYLRRREDVLSQEVFLLGHSEGSLISARLAGTGTQVAGIVLLAGPAQSGEAVLKWQAVQVAKGIKGFSRWVIKLLRIDVLKSQQKYIEKIKRSKKDSIRIQLVSKIPAKWFREFTAYDPTEDLSRVAVPVLAITGSKDIQVDPADLQRMAEFVKAPFESHVIQDMTHMLRVETGEASISNYKAEIKRPIEPSLLDTIRDWLNRQTGSREAGGSE